MDFSRFERYRDLVGDWQAFCDTIQAPLPVTLWANSLRLDRQTLAGVLLHEGVESSPLAWYERGLRIAYGGRPGKTLAFVAGYCHIQEEVSMLPVALLDPRPGERILDLCAAPGNKTAQAAIHMEARGLVVANDVNERRLGMVARNVERLGLTNVLVCQGDGSSLPASLGGFDRVLADVPCSCEGTTRKNPEILWREPPKRSPVGAQTAILRKAVQLCRPGGRVVYSTCTYAPEENEGVVDSVLRDCEGKIRLRPISLPGFDFAPGLDAWQGRSYLPELRHCVRAWPHRNDTGGFFIAVLDRLGQGEEAADS